MKRRLHFRTWLAALLFLCAGGSSTWGQGTLYTIITNGPTAKRFNVVILAEGYTTNQLSLFLWDATNAANNLVAQSPLSEYRSYFNFHAIFVPSAEAGSDHPLAGTYKNTYFSSSFDSYGISQLITIPPNSFDGDSSHGQGKVNSQLSTLMPDYDIVVLLVNDPEFGGSGSHDPDIAASSALITSVNLFAFEIIAHEAGHSIAGLADEYEIPYAYTPMERPNATTVTNRSTIKWASWILGSTPVPTPESADFDSVVGAFQGAQYQTTGWYRPKLDCKMRTIGYGGSVPFCEVCSEQLVKSVYGHVRPLDSFAPSATNLGIYSTQTVAFSVTPLQPATHNLAVQWFTNNTPVSGATNPAFSLAPKLLGNGAHSLKAVVSDPTSLVRNDATKLLQQTNTWNLTLSLNDFALVSARYLNTNRFRFTVTGTAPSGFIIQASTNLANWVSLSTNVLAGGKYDYTNSNLTTLTQRFYRAVSKP